VSVNKVKIAAIIAIFATQCPGYVLLINPPKIDISANTQIPFKASAQEILK
jgi:hypothetical protein